MANGRRTLTERMTVLETKFDTVIEPMAHKIDVMYESFPEIVRKVDKHHCVFPEHVETLEVLKKKINPLERPSDGNGGFLERRTKKSLWRQFREMPLSKKIPAVVIAIPFIGSYWDWILIQLHRVLDFMQVLSK
jgi:hypothetical protein